MFKRFKKQYGIDLGTSNTVIFEHGKGIVLNEPSVVAVHESSGDILAVGAEAYGMIGRTPAQVEIVYPLRNGVIANFDMASRMLEHFIKKTQKSASWLRGSQVCISVPCGITQVQKRSVEETVMNKGTRKAIVVEEPLAAALGAGLSIEEPLGHLILDIGGGTTQAAILSLGGIVASHTIQRAGTTLDQDIMGYMKRQHNLEIGERTAEGIKIKIGTAIPNAEERKLSVRGRDLISGLPRSVQVASSEIFAIADDYLHTLIEVIRTILERCPPELSGDVVEHGIMLCGGGALLDGIDKRIQAETNVPVHLAERPLECTALGTGLMWEQRHSNKVTGQAPLWREEKPENAEQIPAAGQD